MTSAAPKAIAVQRAIDEVMRNDRGRLMAGLIARLGDFQLAEDALQDALISALKHWSRTGVPHSPIGWLMKVGLNKGIDQIRSRQREVRKADDLKNISQAFDEIDDPDANISDERLRLIFTCCHPALEEKSRIALTLRTVCGLTTREIAAAFLDTEQTMGQRLSRAKAKIKSKGIAFSVPDADQWQDRLDNVLSTLYLIFTTGYVNEDKGPRDLCREAIFLARLLRQLHPGEAEIDGALALMLLTDARQGSRIASSGILVPIEAQNHALWHHEDIAEAQNLLADAVQQQNPGPFQIKAAIADCHMARPKPDWEQISLLYQSLWRYEPTPVVALNWAVVMAEIGHLELALEKLDMLQGDMEIYQPWYAARAHILQKIGRNAEAKTAYQKAIEAAPNKAAAQFLEQKLRQIVD